MANATNTENAIAEIKRLIELQGKDLQKISSDINDLKISVAKLDEKVGGLGDRIKTAENTLSKLPEIAEKIGELKNWRQIALIVIAGSISAIFGWLLRGGKI
jgi:septal ring factor EnvC (AmiA/AmiB activator)